MTQELSKYWFNEYMSRFTSQKPTGGSRESMWAWRESGAGRPLGGPAETAEPLALAQSEDRKTGGWTEERQEGVQRDGGEGAGRMEELQLGGVFTLIPPKDRR